MQNLSWKENRKDSVQKLSEPIFAVRNLGAIMAFLLISYCGLGKLIPLISIFSSLIYKLKGSML